MIDCIAGYHLNPWTCGIAKFNMILAQQLGLPVVGIQADALAGFTRPLLSIKMSEFADADASALDGWAQAHAGRFELFLHAFDGIPGVTSAREWMTPRTNLGVQSALVAHARYFLGTCGGLAWLAPFMGVPAVAVYDDDALLRPHLTIARLAGERVRAAEFASLDLRALRRIDAGQLC